MRQDAYSQHVDSGCQSQYNLLPSGTSVDETLKRPTAPLTPVELKLQTRLAKCSLAVCPEKNVLRMKTGGQVRVT